MVIGKVARQPPLRRPLSWNAGRYPFTPCTGFCPAMKHVLPRVPTARAPPWGSIVVGQDGCHPDLPAPGLRFRGSAAGYGRPVQGCVGTITTTSTPSSRSRSFESPNRRACGQPENWVGAQAPRRRQTANQGHSQAGEQHVAGTKEATDAVLCGQRVQCLGNPLEADAAVRQERFGEGGVRPEQCGCES